MNKNEMTMLQVFTIMGMPVKNEKELYDTWYIVVNSERKDEYLELYKTVSK